MKPLLSTIVTLLLFTHAACAGQPTQTIGSNIHPIAFAVDQTIVDIGKVVWEPLRVEGLDPGGEIAVLRGSLEKGHSESLLRLPPGYRVPLHNHTSDELYLWIEGPFTLIAHDRSQSQFEAPAYISFPGNAPPHGLQCGPKKSCLLYLKYSRPFDIHYPAASRKRIRP